MMHRWMGYQVITRVGWGRGCSAEGKADIGCGGGCCWCLERGEQQDDTRTLGMDTDIQPAGWLAWVDVARKASEGKEVSSAGHLFCMHYLRVMLNPFVRTTNRVRSAKVGKLRPMLAAQVSRHVVFQDEQQNTKTRRDETRRMRRDEAASPPKKKKGIFIMMPSSLTAREIKANQQ